MTARVATDDRGVLDIERANRVPVDHHVMRRHGQPPDRTPDREHRRMINVDPIDLAHGGGAEADRQGTLADAPRELLALRTVELLRVVDATDGARVGRHHDGACDDGAREGAPSDFIDPREEWTARSAQILLERAPAARHAGRTE